MTRCVMRAATLAAVLGSAVSGLATSALATNDGHLDGVWLSIRFKSRVNLVSFDGPGDPVTTDEKVKLDTGKHRCYVRLYWNGPDSATYQAVTICRDASDDWDWVWWDTFYEVSDADGSIADDWTEFHLLVKGDDFSDEPVYSTEGYAKLTPKIDKHGVVKKIKYTGNKGKKTMAYREEGDADGTGEGRLKLKVVDESKVPEGAQEAFLDWLE